MVPRFTTIDPKAEQFPWQSPYCYAANNPIKFIDKNGENAIIPPGMEHVANTNKSITGPFIMKTANKMANNITLATTCVVMPIANAVHAGLDGGFRAENRNWATPLSIDENWNIVSRTDLGGETVSFEKGKEIMNATVYTITLAAPVKGVTPNAVTDMAASFVGKQVVRASTSTGLDAIDQEQSTEQKQDTQEQQSQTTQSNNNETVQKTEEPTTGVWTIVN